MRVKKYIVPLFSILMMTSVNLYAQKAYDLMLKTVYKNTVPLIGRPELDSLKDVFFLDTRERKEYQTSHISGARFVGYEGFSKKSVKDIPRDKNIVVYCSVGYRSERIGEKLLDMGFTSVNNLYGGIFQWKNEGNKVVDGQGNVTDTVHTYNRLWSVWLKNGIKRYD